MTRLRACGALIHGDAILMVRHVEPTRSYWTLPGGGLEAGETPAEAAIREMREETGLNASVVRLLFERFYFMTRDGVQTKNPEYVFLVELTDQVDGTSQTAMVSSDPEDAHLPIKHRLLQDVAWQSLEIVKDHRQIALVLEALAGNG